MQPRISMITLGVGELRKAIVFYEKGLGLPRIESPPEVAFLHLTEHGWGCTGGRH